MYDSNYALLQPHSFDDSIRFQRNRQYASKLLIWNLYHLLSMLLQYSPTNVVLLANSIGRLDVDYVCTIEISSWARLLLEIASTNTRAKKRRKKKSHYFTYTYSLTKIHFYLRHFIHFNPFLLINNKNRSRNFNIFFIKTRYSKIYL